MMPGTKNIREEVLDLRDDLKGELTLLKNNQQPQEKKIDKIKQSLDNIEWLYEKIFKDLNGFVENQEKTEDLLNFKEEESRHLRTELSRLQGKVDMLMKKLHTSSSSIQNIRSSYQIRMQEIELIREDLLKKSSEESTKRRKVEIEYKRLKEGYKNQNKELGTARDHVVRLSKQIESLKDALKAQILKQQDNTKEKALLDKIKSVASERDHLKGANEQFQASIASHKEQILGLRENISVLKIEKTKLEVHISNQEKNILALVQSNKALEKKYAEITKSLSEKSQELKLINDKNASAAEERKALLVRLRAFEKELKSITEEKHAKVLEIHQLEAQIASLKKSTEDYEQLLNQIQEKELNEQALESEVKQLSVELADAKAEILKKDEIIHSYKQDLSNFRGQELKMRSEFAEKERVLQNKIEHMQVQKDELQSLNFTLKSDVNNLTNEVASQQDLIENLEQKYKDTLAQNISDQQSIESLSASIQALEIKNRQILEELEMAIREGERTHAEQEELQHQIQNLQEKLVDEESKTQKAIEEKFFESEKLASLNTSYKESLSKIEDYATRVHELENALEAERSENKKKSTELLVKTKRLESLEETHAEILLKKSQAEAQVLSLTEELNLEQEKAACFQAKEQEAITKLAESEAIRARLASEKYIDMEQIKSLQDSLDDASVKANSAITAKAQIENELVQEKRKNEDLQFRLENVMNELTESESNLISINENYSLEQNRHRVLQLSFNELENYNKELEEHKAVLEESLSQEKETGEELRKELEASKVVLESMQMKEIEFLDQEKELRLQNDSLTSQNKDLKDKVEMIEQEINTRKEFYKKTVREYETKISEYKAKIDEAYSEIKNLKNEMATMQKDHHSQTKSLEDKLAIVGRAESEKLETLSKREEKLNYYSRWIDIQKQNLQSHVLTLAHEMKASLEINPLKTYLKITEKEISNMKVALSKMMAFDPNKPQAEMQYEQLILQRDEVQEALNKLSVEVESRVSNLKNMLKSSEFVPTPPLPPQK